MTSINISNTTDIILKVFGLRGWINRNYNRSDILKEVIIEVDDDNNVNEKYIYKNDFFYKIRFIERPINYLYFMMIMLILLIEPVFNIVIAFIYNDVKYVSGNIFSFLYIVQYVFGLRYFSSFHYEQITKRNEKYKKVIFLSIILFLIIAFILSALIFIFLPLGINIVSYSHVYNNITNDYFKALYLNIDTNETLHNLQSEIASVFLDVKYEFLPHLSLLYKHLKF